MTCGPQAVGFFAESGVTYFIVAFDDQFDGGGNGGQLAISVDAAPPPPEISFTIDPTGRVNPSSGVATVSGTVTCAGEAVDFAEISGDVAQRAGRAIIRGFFFTGVTCDGTTHAWTAEVFPDNGRFAGGRATVNAFGVACNPFSCGEAFESRNIRLRGSN